MIYVKFVRLTFRVKCAVKTKFFRVNYKKNMNSILKPNAVRSLTAKALNFNASRLGCVRYGSFKVQDDKDFLEKVENSKEPVIVDFFAT